jgi:hypothetical protein
MLFGPEDHNQFGDPDVEGREAMETGVAGGADGDQEIRIAVARMAVMNMEAIVPRPAAAAAK